MSFFEAPPPPPEPEQTRQPEWVGPPENVLPAPFDLQAVLVRTGELAIAVHGGLAYPNGFTFRLALQRRTEQQGPRGNPFLHHWHMRGGMPDEALRFGVQFADGQKATMFHRPAGPDGEMTGPALMQRGGSGGSKAWDFGFWVWPLPPAGPFSFVCEWPSEGIALTSIEVDAAPIREAASRAERLWPDDDGPSGSGGMIFSRPIG
jgi:hypothetical protein